MRYQILRSRKDYPDAASRVLRPVYETEEEAAVAKAMLEADSMPMFQYEVVPEET